MQKFANPTLSDEDTGHDTILKDTAISYAEMAYADVEPILRMALNIPAEAEIEAELVDQVVDFLVTKKYNALLKKAKSPFAKYKL